ncbi:MAG: crotonase/enoyl-CoA hydratase family protein [Gammaproteobacteria bacterium]|nr:crotonase/enoyl-CoA hydratase family protein [Gammaproteobacteria bacterium]
MKNNNDNYNDAVCQTNKIKDNSITSYTQFTTRYDSETSTIWCWMSPTPRPCMNGALIDELVQLQQQITNTYQHKDPDTTWPFRHLVLASKITGIYNLGGDLELIKKYIENKEENKLREYAYKATNLIHRNINNLDLPITMVSLVQGQALGAGFEAALSCDVIIAEKSSRLGFPEILFNMFPGMGAYNLLARRIGSALAERIIVSGKTYTAEELFDMGIIDVIADDGEGILATKDYLNSHNQSHNTIRSMKKIRQIVHPISQQDLFDIVDIWMEAAMTLSKKDLAKMNRLLFLQKLSKDSSDINSNEEALTSRGSEWRKITDASFPLTTHLGENITQNRRKSDCRRQEKLPDKTTS